MKLFKKLIETSLGNDDYVQNVDFKRGEYYTTLDEHDSLYSLFFSDAPIAIKKHFYKKHFELFPFYITEANICGFREITNLYIDLQKNLEMGHHYFKLLTGDDWYESGVIRVEDIDNAMGYLVNDKNFAYANGGNFYIGSIQPFICIEL